MHSPFCRVIAVGETTPWAKQFLARLLDDNLIELAKEPSVEKFCKDYQAVLQPPIAFIENSPESRKWVDQIRSQQVRSYLVWYGRGFSKEDFAFAINSRIYAVLDNTRPDDAQTTKTLEKVTKAARLQQDYEQIIRSLKAVLIEGDVKSGAEHFVAELKTAVSKLERSNPHHEFLTSGEELEASQGAVPFHKNQDLGDALTVIHKLERTGTLFVAGQLPDQEGAIDFLQGKIVSAMTGRCQGVKAVYRMFLWDTPRFAFSRKQPEDFQVEAVLSDSIRDISAQGEKYRQRFNQIRKELPPTDLVLALEPSALHAGVNLNREEYSTLTSVVEHGKVGQVLDYNPLPDVLIYEGLISLKRNNLIRVE